MPFTVAVESLSLDLRMALIARGHGIGIATSASLACDKWCDAVRAIVAVDFQPRVRCWLIRRHPLGRLERPLQIFRDAVAANVKRDGPQRSRLTAPPTTIDTPPTASSLARG